MGYIVLVGGLSIIAGGVSYITGKSTEDKKYEPVHRNNQRKIEEQNKSIGKLESFCKTQKEKYAKIINHMNDKL